MTAENHKTWQEEQHKPYPSYYGQGTISKIEHPLFRNDMIHRQIATTAEQSRRLIAYGVDPNTADMSIRTIKDPYIAEDVNWHIPELKTLPYIEAAKIYSGDKVEPAWSLSALLALLPTFVEIDDKMWFEFNRDVDGYWYAGYRRDKRHMLEPTPIHTSDPFEALMPVCAWIRREKFDFDSSTREMVTIESIVDMIDTLPGGMQHKLIERLNKLIQ